MKTVGRASPTQHSVPHLEARPESARVVLIANLGSRRTEEMYERAQRLLAEQAVPIAESYAVRTGSDLRKLVAQAVRSRAGIVIVGGGDGTLTSVVGEFAHRETILGVLPFGTGNSFARSLGLKPTIAAAVDTIAGGRVARVDLGLVNGTHFANFTAIGLSSKISQHTPAALKKAFGPLAYVLAGIGPTLRSQAFEAVLEWPGGSEKLTSHQLIVASGRYYGLVPIVPDASIVDGKLDVFTATGFNRWEIARMFVALFFGMHTRLTEAEYFSGPEVTVTIAPPQKLDVDGELRGTTPARFSVDPKALRVLVPEGFTGY
jgi:YegS/Rv2252/BmrU family lipid kinase